MPILETQLNARSADFVANANAMRALVADLNAQTDKAAMGGGDAARAKHTARGKLLPRDRVHNLLDAGTPFLELSPLAAMGMYPDRDGTDSAPCAGVIAGIGRVSGVDCMIVCNDATEQRERHEGHACCACDEVLHRPLARYSAARIAAARFGNRNVK